MKPLFIFLSLILCGCATTRIESRGPDGSTVIEVPRAEFDVESGYVYFDGKNKIVIVSATKLSSRNIETIKAQGAALKNAIESGGKAVGKGVGTAARTAGGLP